MLIGDIVETEIYGPVTIKKVFRSVREMVANGYAIPTGDNDTGYQVNGKVFFARRKVFAAAPLDKRSRDDLVRAELPIKRNADDDEEPQEEYIYS